jgi:hypothetical protein
MRIKALAIVGALVAAIVFVGPVAAAGGPAVTSCRYEATEVGQDGWTEAQLKRIAVNPPEMYPLNGANTQKVSWRFTVERYIGNDPYTAKRTYRSPRQFGTAATDQAAPFSPMSVHVNLPTVSGNHDLTDVHYLVLVTRVWYNPDGTVYSLGNGSNGKYRVYVDGEFQGRTADFAGCAGEVLQSA